MSIGERLDNLLSTSEDDFNFLTQTIIIQETPKGQIFPSEEIVEYLENLKDAFFFCLENYKNPFLCIEYIIVLAENDNYLLCLVDSILHLASKGDRWANLSLLPIQLTNLRHEISPYNEDEEVKAIIKNMERPKRRARRRTASFSFVNSQKSKVSITEQELDQPSRALYWFYLHDTGSEPDFLKHPKGKLKAIEELVGNKSSKSFQMLYNAFVKYDSRTNKSNINRIKKVLPFLEKYPQAHRKATDELKIAQSK